ncbi:MAG TPA: ferredoxin [Candidatus Ozemobacteraceae bacterium]|nr:ferredoxin [Candidatus Ozemobacteraceae bacterium]
MKAKVNPEICIGCGMCVGTCPEVFHMENDKAVVVVETVPAPSCAACRQACQECPVQAIELQEP